MNESKLTTIAQLEEFLSASASIEFKPDAGGDCERHAHISAVLRRFDYPRRERGVLLAYRRHTSGSFRARMTRLVDRWQESRLAPAPLAKRPCAPTAPFPRKYTPSDVALLVEMDRANEDVCGPAIVHLLRRAFEVYGDPRYERWAQLSVSHLYNLRKSTGYQHQRVRFTKTRAACNPIGAQGSTAQRARRLCACRHRASGRVGVKGVYQSIR